MGPTEDRNLLALPEFEIRKYKYQIRLKTFGLDAGSCRWN
jgi:hypothetical protein